jgi:hypothetical protein
MTENCHEFSETHLRPAADANNANLAVFPDMTTWSWSCPKTILKATCLKRLDVQCASDGAWERAVSADGCTDDWIKATGENIAIEAVYLRPSGELAGFVGFRKIISDPAERCVFWKSVISKASFSAPDTPSTQASIWLQYLNLSFLLKLPPSFIDLGVFNQWRSAGTIRLTSERFVLSKIPDAPAWLQDGADAPICKEAAWDIGDGFWVADNVSTKIGGRYHLCAEQPDDF